MKWFRLHSEFANDPKLKTFTKAQRYDLICLLCLANDSKERGVIALDAEDIAATLDMEEADYSAFISKLEKKGILSVRDDGAVIFTNWITRQYDKPSDTPEETAKRKRDSREQQKPAETVSRGSHAEVTPSHAPYSDTDTEYTQKDKTPPAEGDAPAQVVPVPKQSKQRFQPPSAQESLEYFALKGKPDFSEKFWNYWESVGWKRAGKPMVDWQAAARNWITEECERQNIRAPARASPVTGFAALAELKQSQLAAARSGET